MQQLDWGTISQYIFPVAIILLLVFVMILPQRKRDKKVREMLANVKVGDKVRTIGGVYGTVVDVKENLLTLETSADKTKLEFAKGAISTVENADVEADMPSK